MDVVYVVRPGDRNEPLRWSLRSLAHLPHGRVWMAGHRPTWVSDEVGHIPVPRQASKYVSSTSNLLAAAQRPEVSDEFWYFNDDFFIMNPVEHIPVLHRGPIDAHADRVRARWGATAGGRRRPYLQGMEQTAALLSSLGRVGPLSYELHVPMLLRKDWLLEVLTLPAVTGSGIGVLHKRSLYGNYHRIGGIEISDVKARKADDEWDGEPLLSTCVSSWRGRAGAAVRARFPAPSVYEEL